MIDLDKILELEAKATPVKHWRPEVDSWGEILFNSTGPHVDTAEEAWIDAELIAAMRNNIRQICFELKAAREENEKLKKVAEAARQVTVHVFIGHGLNDLEDALKELDGE